MKNWPFGDLQPGKYGVVYADPAWRWEAWSDLGMDRAPDYQTMSLDEIAALPVGELAAPDCVLLMWFIWPLLPHALKIIGHWGFRYKTCGFSWMKARVSQLDFFDDVPDPVSIGPGYWTRSNNESCLLATRGHPKRLNADVRQGVIWARREHSRKPDLYDRIERLVPGPYCELFARQRHRGWDSWGNEIEKFPAA